MWLLLALLAAPAIPLEKIGEVEVLLSRDCRPACPLLVRLGAAQITVDDLDLPQAPPRRESGEWSLDGVLVSVVPLQLGTQVEGILIGSLRVPPGEGRALGAWRVVTAAEGELRLSLTIADRDPRLDVGRVHLVDQVLHFLHESPSPEEEPDRFDHAAWRWVGRMRELPGATLFAVAIAAGPGLPELRRKQHDAAARCGMPSLRTYASIPFEGIPGPYFSGKVFLRREEARTALETLRPCVPTSEIFETAWSRR